MNQEADKYDEQASDAALGWVARLRSDVVSEEDRQSFALWLNENSANSRTMDEALELWDDLGVVQHLAVAPTSSTEAANNSRWMPTAVAAAACLVLAVFLWPLMQSDPVSNQYRSAVGERLEVVLPDGSLARLNTNSQISVTYSDDQRLIDLQKGEVWFQVQSNKEKPFHVDAGDARVTALGTAFNIHRKDSGTQIAVTEGVVRVTDLREVPGRAPTFKILRVNQQLLAQPQGWEISTADNLDRELAWQQGQLVAQEMPLHQLVAELQRHSNTKIFIADPSLVNRTVSGVFELDEPETSLQALAISLGLEIQPVGDSSVQLLKADQ